MVQIHPPQPIFLNFKFADKKNVNIKYNIIGAIKHMLGYQNKLNLYNKILGIIPMYIDQTFYKKKKTLILRFSENKIFSSENFKFGDSIHYNNFQINNLHINSYLNSISKNLYCISMPASKQKLPGPISNDILNNITNILSYD